MGDDASSGFDAFRVVVAAEKDDEWDILVDGLDRFWERCEDFLKETGSGSTS